MEWLKRVILCTILLCGLLAGCGQTQSDHTLANTATDTKSEKDIYYLESINIPDAKDTFSEYLQKGGRIEEANTILAEGNIYRAVMLYDDYKNSIQILGAPYKEWITYLIDFTEWEKDYIWFIHKICDVQQGRILVLLTDGENYALGSWDEENGAHIVKKLSEEDGDVKVLSDGVFQFGENGTLYSHSIYDMENQIFSYNAQWDDKSVLHPEEKVIQLLWDNVEREILYCGKKGDIPGVYSLAEKRLLYSLEGTKWASGYGYCALSEKERYVSDVQGVWMPDKEEKPKLLAEFLSVDYVPDKVYGMTVSQDGVPLVLVKEDETLGLFGIYKGEEKREKQELYLTVDYLSPFWKKQIAAYNKQSKQYRVIIEELSNIDERTLLQMEITTGRGPDMIQDYLLDVNTYAENGYLLDLTEALQEENKSLLESVNNSYKAPIACWLDTLVINKTNMADKASWTIDEMIEIVEASPATVFWTGEDPAILVSSLIFSDVASDRFINHQQGVCYLDGEEFQNILNFTKEYLNTNAGNKDGMRVQSGEIFAYPLYLDGMYWQNFVSGMFQGEDCYIGYPSESGSGHFICTNAIVVNRATKHPEGVIDFIKYLQSEAVQDNLAKTVLEGDSEGYPVREASLEKALHMATQKEKMSIQAVYLGVSFYQEGITQEKAEELLEVFRTAQPKDTRNDFVYSILSDELPLFIAGERTVEQTAQIIQNRVQLYLDENY